MKTKETAKKEKKGEKEEAEEKPISDKILIYAIIAIVGLFLIFVLLRYVIPSADCRSA